jgi:hypothetical protein
MNYDVEKAPDDSAEGRDSDDEECRWQFFHAFECHEIL